MHKAKTSKLLISIVSVFALVFGGVAVAVAPSNAAGITGCTNANETSGNRCLIPTNQSYTYTEGVAIAATSSLSNLSGATYSLQASQSLPTGLTLDSNTGVITGTPSSGTAQSAFEYVIEATVPATSKIAKAYVSIAIVASGSPTITTTDSNLELTKSSPMTASSGFSKSLFTSGCSVTYAISPAQPDGLNFSSSNGALTGTPTTVQASAPYVVTATEDAASPCDPTKTAVATIYISIAEEEVRINSSPTQLDRKVTICHRTHATTNPYVRITVDYNSVNRASGHQGHDEIFAGEHVFKAGIYKRAKDKDWGDIIPADPTGKNRWQPLNWTVLGAQIYNGTVAGCPAYDAVKYYNSLREAGVPEKQIKKEMADLETEQSEADPSREKKDTETLKYSGTDKKALEEEKDKVTICHRTNSTTNPYVKITVAASSIYKNAGHYGHDEIYDGHHVFDSTVAYPNNKKDWGDIIPADPSGKNRWAALNMTALGKKIYDGTVEGCSEKTMQQVYNELREEGKSKKEIIADLEKQKNLDEDPKDLDELEYTGNDPEVEKSEPKEPTDPSDPSNLNPVKIPDQSLSGIVWLDINKDGLKDPDEPLMKNIKLYVVQMTSIPAPVTPANLGLRAASTLRRADSPVRSAAVQQVLTDENGFYLFASLGAGDWMVTTTIPEDLYVTYDSHESSDGSITTTVPVASHAFTWVGLVGDDEKVTLAKLTEILKENPNALPESQLPTALKALVKKAKAAAAGKTSGVTLAETGAQDLAWFYFGILLMLTGVALRFARTKQ